MSLMIEWGMMDGLEEFGVRSLGFGRWKKWYAKELGTENWKKFSWFSWPLICFCMSRYDQVPVCWFSAWRT